MRQILKYQRLWLVLAIAALVIAAHGVVLYYVSSALGRIHGRPRRRFRARPVQAFGTTRAFPCDIAEVAQQTMTMIVAQPSPLNDFAVASS
jgi:hypothetical protein